MKNKNSKDRRYGAILLAAAILLAFPAAASAQGLSTQAAENILKELDDLGNFPGKDYTSLFTIVSEKPGEKQSVSQVRVFRRDTKKQFTILVMLPEVNKGQGYLREEDNVWFYDPTSRKFSHSSVKENLQNSEAKNSDFTASSMVDDYTIEKVTEGTIGKYPVWILDLKARTNEVPYERVLLYVRKDRTMILKQEDFSVNGRLMRTTLYPKYVTLDGKLLPSQILIVDEINKGEKSQITMAEQAVEKLPDKVFTKAFLEQVNR
ncbi:MAG: outer membrane lipoprotein-sorting protein [Rectinemataceae bacterium]|nr:outer membrane lipoprotein-sorting protein [Rectinemataceae bacterium]